MPKLGHIIIFRPINKKNILAHKKCTCVCTLLSWKIIWMLTLSCRFLHKHSSAPPCCSHRLWQ